MSAATIDADSITVTQAAQRPAGSELLPGEQDYQGPDGTRSAMLVRVSDIVTQPSTLPKAKPGDTYSWRTWTFMIDDGSEYEGQILQVRASVVSSNSDKSKQYQIINALAGKTVPVGASLSIRNHLVNRSCFISITSNDQNYPQISGFMAIPVTGKGKAAAPAPVVEAAPVAVAPDELPF